MRYSPQTRTAGVVALAALLSLAAPAGAAAQRADQLPPELTGVGITEKLGDPVPLDTTFVDESGATVTLSSFMGGDRPVILNLGYYRCPMLCGLVLNGMLAGMKDLAWTPGKEFEVVTISIDPSETPALARLKKQNMMQEYHRPGAAAGWHFLTGDEKDIRAVADAVGFRYRYDEKQQQYAHAAGIVLLTPDGTVARYLYGIDYPSKSLRLALTEAADGSIGSPVDQLLLYCFCYDPNARGYVLQASRVMTAGGAATALILGVWLGTYWRREVKNRTREEPER